MPKLKHIIPMLLPLIVMFYYIYPQALDIRGSSFISLSGVVGLGVYAYHRFPFKEVVFLLCGFFVLFFTFYSSTWINGAYDDYSMSYAKSQIACLFSAYLVIFLIFKTHVRPSLNTVLLYIIAAIALQSFLAFLMYISEPIETFLFSLQMQVDYTEEIREEAGRQRLMGYGIGFFGAGAISGIALILLSYLFMRMKLKTTEFVLLAGLYVLIFYIGLFMARTTIVGMAVGFGVIAVLYIWDNRAVKKQAKTFVIASIFLMAAGYVFAMFYFSSFSDWAFELFTNLFVHGRLETKSSSGLAEMFIIPEETWTLIFGTGSSAFFGSDVGYTRILFYVGIIGGLAFFLYPLFIIKLSMTKDWGVNIVAFSIYVYSLALNIKGLIELNLILYLIFFYFMFYRYYIYYPKQYRMALKRKKMREAYKKSPTEVIDITK
ncbi:MAG: hypothetical protein ACK5KL_11420 [Dysgonomonas sp.]|nr:hypothetical protein [Prevotella sp.]MDR3059647.1 hypothetical protein [Prevotella sp.]